MKKIIKNTLALVMIISVLLSTFTGCGKKEGTASAEPEIILETECVTEAVTEEATEPVSDDVEDSDDAGDSDDEYKPIVESEEKDAYLLIGKEISGYNEVNNAKNIDGGFICYVDNCDGYAVSTLSDVDKGTIKVVYIAGYDKCIMKDIFTGKKYADYSAKISGLTAVSYDASSLAYACSFKEKINDKDVTIWLYFNNPEGKCTGAIITAEKLKGSSVTAKATGGKFLYQFEGLPCGELFDAYPVYYSKNLFGVMNYLEPDECASVILDKNINDYSVDEYRETVACSISYDTSLVGNEDKTVSFNGLEIVPGIKIGDSRNSVMNQGYSISEGNYGPIITRIGAKNIYIPMVFDENDKLDSVGSSMFD